MRIAIDIDSTLHHYWDLLSDAAQRRFGVELPYEEQLDWGITQLRPEQLGVCIAETHSDDVIRRGEPYPGAVAVVSRWHAEGHYIHITSHRSTQSHAATAEWLTAIGLRHDDLYCSYDKVARCRQLQIDLLIDDSPVNLANALDQGILAATIVHPWNRELVETEDIVGAADWHELDGKLAPLFARDSRAA